MTGHIPKSWQWGVILNYDDGSMFGNTPTVYCARCGTDYTTCCHYNTADPSIKSDEARRINARWGLGRLHNPDHDATSYRDPK